MCKMNNDVVEGMNCVTCGLIISGEHGHYCSHNCMVQHQPDLFGDDAYGLADGLGSGEEVVPYDNCEYCGDMVHDEDALSHDEHRVCAPCYESGCQYDDELAQIMDECPACGEQEILVEYSGKMMCEGCKGNVKEYLGHWD